MPLRKKIHIGTSGWRFGDWKGSFYPQEMKGKEFLPLYAQAFDTVEINSTFYRLPREDTIKKWCDITPDHFVFSCKASRYITHMKKLKEPEESLSQFLNLLKGFGKKLGVILFQFPPQWALNLERLEAFLPMLPKGIKYAFEFRHLSWFCSSVYQLLGSYNMALCIYDYKGYQSPEISTADFIYVRLHGPKKRPYEGHYSKEALEDYARKCLYWSEQGKTIFFYFDNGKKACASLDAKDLMSYMKEEKG